MESGRDAGISETMTGKAVLKRNLVRICAQQLDAGGIRASEKIMIHWIPVERLPSRDDLLKPPSPRMIAMHVFKKNHIFVGICCLLLSGCQSGLPHIKRPIESIHATTVVSLSNEEAVRQSLYAQLQDWQSVDYDYGGLSKSGVDCSGFVYLTYRSHFGIELPRTSSEQANIGQPVVQSQLQSGDLVFFKIGRKTRHVGIYVEGRKFLHASKSHGVKLSSLDNVYWSKKYWKANRVQANSPHAI